MMDFLSTHSLYVVLLIVLICWMGIYGYLYRLDKKVSAIENRMS